MKLGLRIGCVTVALACHGTALAQATAWDEGLNGDLSNDGLAPTPLVVVVGANRVSGSVGNSGQGIDRDYFRFTVPPGATWTSLRLLGNTSVSGSVSFIALQAGPQVTAAPSGSGSENLLGYGHYGNDLIGTDILPQVVFGFTGSLPAGTYSVWVQETGGPATYAFEYGISEASDGSGDVPTLPEWGMLLTGGVLLSIMWRQGRPRRKGLPGRS